MHLDSAIFGQFDLAVLLLEASQMLLQEAHQTLRIVGSEDLTAVDARRLLTWEQTNEVKDKFALRVQDDCEVSVLTLTDFFGELDVELGSFLFCHCFVVSINE